jgi:hypothetical protein
MDAKLSLYKSSSPNTVKYRIKYGNTDTDLNMVQNFDALTQVTWSGSIGAVIVTGLDPMLPWYFQAFAVNAFDVESTGTNKVSTATAPAAPSQLTLVSLT